MKPFKTLLYPMLGIIFITVLLSACTRQIAGLMLTEQVNTVEVSSEQLAFYTRDERRFNSGEFAAALTHAQTINPSTKQTVVFIHGMGPYPNKAFKHEEIQALAETYEAAVVMLHWPSWEGHLMPRQNALATGRLLQPLWQQVALARKQQPRQKFILIAHSMAAEVMRSASNFSQPEVFDELMLAAPETDLAGHAQWLEQLQLSPQKTVLVNRDDNMLPYARSVVKKPRLGMTLKHDGGQPETLAANTRYLVLSGVTDWHSVYASKQSVAVRQLLRRVLLDGNLPAQCGEIKENQTVQINLAPDQLRCKKVFL